jgi:hypothetical protein
VLVGARPYSVKATGQPLEGSGPEAGWPEELATKAVRRFRSVRLYVVSGTSTIAPG